MVPRVNEAYRFHHSGVASQAIVRENTPNDVLEGEVSHRIGLAGVQLRSRNVVGGMLMVGNLRAIGSADAKV